MKKNVYRLDRMAKTKFDELNPRKTMVIAIQSPLEIHGPHLPIGQDLFEAGAIAEAAAGLAAEMKPDWSFVLLHPMPVAADCLPCVGSVGYPVELVRDVAYYSLRPFAANGFARLAYSSFHGGPRHIVALEDAADALTKEFGVPALSFFSVAIARMSEGNIFYKALEDTIKELNITQSQMGRDTHAGLVETSLGLHLWPEMVEPGWESLPPSSKDSEDVENPRSFLFGADAQGPIRKLIDSFGRLESMIKALNHFKNNTYAGYPALSSAESGRKIFDTLADHSRDIIVEFIDAGREMEPHSPLWGFKDLIMNQPFSKFVDKTFFTPVK